MIEIWNLVFIQFNRNEDQSADAAAGEARRYRHGLRADHAGASRARTSNYDTDVFTPIFEAIQKVTGARRRTAASSTTCKDTAYRVIADHIRTLTFALTDGATDRQRRPRLRPQRILRRAERYGWQVLGTNEPFLHQLVPTVVEHDGRGVPGVEARTRRRSATRSATRRTASSARSKRGIKLFNRIAERDDGRRAARSSAARTRSMLHDTYGFLIDITEQMAAGARA